ncbi:hypothetical protein PG991_007748 [Apiospora marii]|uniref:CFEM domain-containing protein n=1 Tax=Apiospora marii TaxID=335849 RepID=A0ABR1RWD4_9PEZI
MVRSFALVAATLFWGNVLAQGDMNACAKGCVVNIFADPSRLGCKPEDKNCACHSGDNLTFGVRDCITQACGLTGEALDKQVAASDQYTNEICLPFTSTAPPAPATTAPPPEPAPAAAPATTATGAAPAPTTADPAKTDAASPEVKDPPGTSPPATGTQAGATSAATSEPTTGASAASADSPSGTVDASSAASSHAAGVAASTASPSSSGAASKEKEEKRDSSAGGLSVAAKAGIGAGAGVVVVMAAITLCCIMMRRRRDNRNATAAAAKGPARPARSPMPCNISKPVAGGRHYAEDVESPAEVNFPFPAACNEKRPVPQESTKSPYKNAREDHYSVQGNKYEDMLPRTQPRTMI